MQSRFIGWPPFAVAYEHNTLPKKRLRCKEQLMESELYDPGLPHKSLPVRGLWGKPKPTSD